MKNKTNLILLLLIMLFANSMLLADYKISQKTTMERVSTETTIYSKGVRERRESRMIMEGKSAEESEMMARMMPNLITISQCDLKQDVTLSEKKKAYFIDYYDWSSLAAEQVKRKPKNEKVVIKGTSTLSSLVTDSGKRQTMFGLPAKWLKFVTSIQNSVESCDGKSDMRIEQEGWYVNLSLNSQQCDIPRSSATATGGCRPRMVIKGAQNPGFLLTGTTKIFDNNKLMSTTSIETTALSKATLDQALFEIPKDYKEVDSLQDLMPGMGDMMDMGAITKPGGKEGNPGAPNPKQKTIAIDFFSGNTSKLDQGLLRQYLSGKLSAAGFSGVLVNSQADISAGNFAKVIRVEIKKIKESGASKIGGIFGKVTGSDAASKIGDSEAEITITIYGSDGKSIVASGSGMQKVKGRPDDAVKAAIDQIIIAHDLFQKI